MIMRFWDVFLFFGWLFSGLFEGKDFQTYETLPLLFFVVLLVFPIPRDLLKMPKITLLFFSLA